MCSARKRLQLGAAITRDPEAALRNSRVSYRLFCFRSSRGHTFQTRLTGSASVRQFDSADRRTTFRGFARLLKPHKSLNSISVSAARAYRQRCCPAPYPPARDELFTSLTLRRHSLSPYGSRLSDVGSTPAKLGLRLPLGKKSHNVPKVHIRYPQSVSTNRQRFIEYRPSEPANDLRCCLCAAIRTGLACLTSLILKVYRQSCARTDCQVCVKCGDGRRVSDTSTWFFEMTPSTVLTHSD